MKITLKSKVFTSRQLNTIDQCKAGKYIRLVFNYELIHTQMWYNINEFYGKPAKQKTFRKQLKLGKTKYDTQEDCWMIQTKSELTPERFGYSSAIGYLASQGAILPNEDWRNTMVRSFKFSNKLALLLKDIKQFKLHEAYEFFHGIAPTSEQMGDMLQAQKRKKLNDDMPMRSAMQSYRGWSDASIPLSSDFSIVTIS